MEVRSSTDPARGGCLAAVRRKRHRNTDGGEPRGADPCAGPQSPALFRLGGERRRRGRRRAAPGRPSRRSPCLLAAPAASSGRCPDPTRPDPTDRPAPRRPVTGRGEARQEVSSGSWVKVPGQERAPCAGSGRGLREALVSLRRFSSRSSPFRGERRALGPGGWGAGHGAWRRAPPPPPLPSAPPRFRHPLPGAPVPPLRRRFARCRERGRGRVVGARRRARCLRQGRGGGPPPPPPSPAPPLREGRGSEGGGAAGSLAGGGRPRRRAEEQKEAKCLHGQEGGRGGGA